MATLGSFVAAVFGHVIWFQDPSRYPIRFDLVFSLGTGLAVGACGLAVLGLFVLQRLLGDPNWPELGLFKRMAVGAPTLVAVQAAVTLVFYGAQGALLSPGARMGATLPGLVLGGLEILVALSFITGLLDWAGAALLALLVLASFVLVHGAGVAAGEAGLEAAQLKGSPGQAARGGSA